MSDGGQIEAPHQSRQIPEAQAQVNAGASFAVIVEWDNARISELGRTRQMLKALQEQVIAHRPKPARPPQVAILYNKNQVDPDIINRVIGESIDGTAWDAIIQIIPTDGLDYYKLKNFGVTQTNREIVIFIDSDVIPEPGWLDALMSAIERPEIDIVGGNTYVTPDNFLGKAFGLFWFYGLRSKQSTLHCHDIFYANNVAFKRALLERYPYPDLDSFRGQCIVLSEQLRRDHITIYRHDGARTEHPATNGFKHFYRRAICHGHDDMTINRVKNTGALLMSPVGSVVRLWHGLRSTFIRAIRHRGDVGLSVLGAAAAMVLGVLYLLLKFFGEIVTYFNPNLVRRYWPI